MQWLMTGTAPAQAGFSPSGLLNNKSWGMDRIPSTLFRRHQASSSSYIRGRIYCIDSGQDWQVDNYMPISVVDIISQN